MHMMRAFTHIFLFLSIFLSFVFVVDSGRNLKKSGIVRCYLPDLIELADLLSVLLFSCFASSRYMLGMYVMHLSAGDLLPLPLLDHL